MLDKLLYGMLYFIWKLGLVLRIKLCFCGRLPEIKMHKCRHSFIQIHVVHDAEYPKRIDTSRNEHKLLRVERVITIIDLIG